MTEPELENVPNLLPMPIPTDLLPSALFPWMLALPALPLVFMLFKRPPSSGLNVAMIVFCISILVSNLFFNLIFETPGRTDDDTLILGVMVDFLLSMGLVLYATGNRTVKAIALVSAVAYVMVVLVLMIVARDQIHMGFLLGGGYLMVFAFSLLAIHHASKEHPTVFLTEVPAFWTAAGLLIHFGLIAMLLFTQRGSDAGDLIKDTGFAWVYSAVNLLRFLLFSASVLSWPSAQEQEERTAKA